MGKNKNKITFTPAEIKRREDNLTATCDAKNLIDLGNRQPKIVECIRELLEVGHSPAEVGQVMRDPNPQMWMESQFAESVARALLNEEN